MSINTKLFIGTTQHSLRFLKCACKNGVYVLWHFRAMVRHEKTPFFQCGYHLRRKYAGVQRDAIPWLWVSNRGEKHPCWHTILLAKSSVLSLWRPLTLERGCPTPDRHFSAAAEQTDFVGCKLQKTRDLP